MIARLLAASIVAAASGTAVPPAYAKEDAPLPEDGSKAILSVMSASCRRCHGDTHSEWLSSRHAQAFTNRNFFISWHYAGRNPWCLQCHAPLSQHAKAEQAERNDLRKEGVNCAVCHLRDGAVVTATPVTEQGVRAHAMVHDNRLGAAEFCGDCHEFAFPDGPQQNLVQSTLTEWRNSEYHERKIPCQDCHMHDGDHGFPGGHQPMMLEKALSAAFCREPGGNDELAGEVRYEITAKAGHRVPTGDPFRRLRVQICAQPDCAQVLVSKDFALTLRQVGEYWQVHRDGRLLPLKTSRGTLMVTENSPQLFFTLSLHFADPLIEPYLPAEEIAYTIKAGEVLTCSR